MDTKTDQHKPVRGDQRLSLERLHEWESLQRGLFLHFGMSTFDQVEMSRGDQPSHFYTPDKLDVDQWIGVARDAGFRYAVLTAKHVSGHCLWPSRHTDYHIGTSGNTTDVVEAFVRACEQKGVLPGLYYCSWDNHHRFGSVTTTDIWDWNDAGAEEQPIPYNRAFTTEEYRDFQTRQIQELLTGYGKIAEVWIDIPRVLPRDYRERLYKDIAGWQPEAVILMNNTLSDGSELNVFTSWPTDLVAIERHLPSSWHSHNPWRKIEGKSYYLPGEVGDPIGRNWFFTPDDRPRPDEELLGMCLIARNRGANILLDVGPDPHGLISQPFADALLRLRKNLDKLGID